MTDGFFPPKPEVDPKIYAYRDSNPEYDGLLKVGFTTQEVDRRVAQQYPTVRPGGAPYQILMEERAVWNDGGSFTDHDVHRYLRKRGFANPAGEWFECTVEDVKAAVIAVREGIDNEDSRTLDFAMRPEQQAAVDKAATYFNSFKKENP
ncbi:MAG: GIY-YIG nuclease family protein, partial [Sphingomonadales bacterium]|nr:GIY-YIG nuclease family protein [Sphingomonadales bacterium]